jgi:hypothetical protein
MRLIRLINVNVSYRFSSQQSIIWRRYFRTTYTLVVHACGYALLKSLSYNVIVKKGVKRSFLISFQVRV